MRRERICTFLTRAMLALALLLCGWAVASNVVRDSGHLPALCVSALSLAGGWLVLSPLVDILARRGPVRTWAVLSALCLAVKLAWALLKRVPVAGDYAVFWGYAQSLSRGPLEYGGGYMALFPHLFGYSAFLSMFIRMVGARLLLAPLLNVLLTLCSGTILFQLCRRWSGLRGATWVYLLWVLFPSQTITAWSSPSPFTPP